MNLLSTQRPSLRQKIAYFRPVQIHLFVFGMLVQESAKRGSGTHSTYSVALHKCHSFLVFVQASSASGWHRKTNNRCILPAIRPSAYCILRFRKLDISNDHRRRACKNLSGQGSDCRVPSNMQDIQPWRIPHLSNRERNAALFRI